MLLNTVSESNTPMLLYTVYKKMCQCGLLQSPNIRFQYCYVVSQCALQHPIIMLQCVLMYFLKLPNNLS